MNSAGHHSMLGDISLPYDHQVEFLESSGTQYINTGVAPNDDVFAMELTFQTLAYNDGCCGTFAGSDNGNCYLNFWSGGLFVRKDGYSSNSTDKDSWNNGGIYFPNGWNNIQLASDIVINGHIVQSNIPKSPRPNAANAILFAYYRRTNIQGFCTMRISKCVIKVNGVVAFDAIPVRKDGVGEMFDRVSGTFATRYGTLVIGPDVSAARGGGRYKRQCVKRSHRRSSRPFSPFWRNAGWRATHSPRTWEVAA